MDQTLAKPQKTVETTFHVRYAETDQMGIVHHSAYVIWVEEGRSHWMRENGSSLAEFEADGLRLAVSDLHLRYMQAAHFDQLVTIRCWLEEVRSRQVQFGYKVFDAVNGDIFAAGHSKHICVDKQNKVARLPERWRELLMQAASS